MSQTTTILTKEDLIAFESDIAREFEAGNIRAPVHLMGGNEDILIELFSEVRPDDWVFSTHRSHYHALLKGVPPAKVKAEIMAGRSICLNFPEYRFFSSAIVGGNLPQAVGVAMTGERVWCFCGDMAAETGMFHECVKFSRRHNLAIRFVVEDNGLSVKTPTNAVWPEACYVPQLPVIRYEYNNTYPHQGTGKNVGF